MKKNGIYFLDENSICRHFELTKTEFKQAMTHNSAPNKNNGSRYVFLGQYGFRGILTKWIFENIGGTGMELQHYLGNIFSQTRLEKLYDEWGLKRFIICGEKCQPEKQKHIFVYSLIGCLMQHTSPDKLEKFMLDFFIFPNDHLLPKVHFHKDDKQKLIFLCKQNNWDLPEITYELLENGKHQFEINIVNRLIYCTSVSYRYAKKKVLKKALDYVAQQLEATLKDNENYLRDETQILSGKAAEKQAELIEKKATWDNRLEEKRKLRAKRLKDKKLAAKLRDEERRKMKEEIKKKKPSRKGKNTIYKEYTSEEIAAMNPAKRRMLEDKGILQKN